jgi:hypothetical protein
VNLTLLVILVAVAIAAIAFALYKAGFGVEKLKVKLGIVEVEAGRDKSMAAKPSPPTGAQIRQRAEEGAIIIKSGITAPADAAAKITQQAKGEKSKIDDSPIKLD